jgi:hypothetical protein
MGMLARLTDWRATRQLEKARGIIAASEAKVQPTPPRHWSFDPELLSWTFSGGTGIPGPEHPGSLGLDYNTFITMARLPVIGAIIQTRIQQVGEFAQPQLSPYSVGFHVRLRDLRRKPTRAEQKKAHEMEQQVMRAGGHYQPGGFDAFLRMLVRDALTYDQANFEIIRERGGIPWGFSAVDASTIRRAKPSDKAMAAGRWDPEKIAFVQVVRDQIRNEYSRKEMAWGIRRPRTWLYANGYGYPELEELVTIVTDLVNAQTYNAANFHTGIHAQTLFVLLSTMNEDAFRAFQRTMTAMLTGPRNSKRAPVVQLDPGGGTMEGGASAGREEIKAINLSQDNKSMQYADWINWLLKIACACYQMDPAELGFVFGNEGQGIALNQRGPEERIWASKERGLRPLLRCVQTWLNEWFIYQLDPAFMLEFVGFDSLSEQQKMDLDVKAVKAYKTVDELRAEHDMDPLGDEIGNMILDPTFFQAWQQMQAGAGEAEEVGGGFEAGAVEGGAEEMLRSVIADVQQAAEEGRLIRKSQRRTKGAWVPVPTRSGGTVKAYMVEVD